MRTTENLWSAFAGESQANRKYLAYANKAESEGYAQIGRLFRAVAELAGPVQRATSAEGTTIGINDGEVTGQTVPHVHVHIVPRRRGDGAGSIHSMFPRGQRQPVAAMAGAIRKEISR